MPEPPAWRYQKIIKPMFDLPQETTLLRGRVLTCVGDEAIEDGFVEIADGRIRAVGAASELGGRADQAVATAARSCPDSGTATRISPGTASTRWPTSRWTTPPRSAPTSRRATCSRACAPASRPSATSA